VRSLLLRTRGKTACLNQRGEEEKCLLREENVGEIFEEEAKNA